MRLLCKPHTREEEAAPLHPVTRVDSAEKELALCSFEVASALHDCSARAKDLKRKERELDEATESFKRATKARDAGQEAVEKAREASLNAREKQKEASDALARAEQEEKAISAAAAETPL